MLLLNNRQTDVGLTLTAEPVGPSARIREIDIVRGAALFGVVLMNLIGTTEAFMPKAVGAALPTAPLDRIVASGADWLVSGKAQCLFGTLFGVGFALFTERLRRRGGNAARTYARRLLFLFALGLLQLFFLWHGDILHDYAFAGLALLVTARLPDRALLTLGVFLQVFGISAVAGVMILFGPAAHHHSAWRAEFWPALATGDYRLMVVASWQRAVSQYWGSGFFSLEGMFIGQFFVGVWIYRQGWLQNPARHRSVFRRLALLLLPVGLVLAWFDPSGDSISIRHHTLAGIAAPTVTLVATSVLAYGYAAALLVLCPHFDGTRVMRLLGALGRMALTNYLSQSVFYFLVIDGFGFGLIRVAGASLDLLMAIGLVIVQAVASAWWLARFRYGPAEWVWRSATYGAWQRFRI